MRTSGGTWTTTWSQVPSEHSTGSSRSKVTRPSSMTAAIAAAITAFVGSPPSAPPVFVHFTWPFGRTNMSVRVAMTSTFWGAIPRPCAGGPAIAVVPRPAKVRVARSTSASSVIIVRSSPPIGPPAAASPWIDVVDAISTCRRSVVSAAVARMASATSWCGSVERGVPAGLVQAPVNAPRSAPDTTRIAALERSVAGRVPGVAIRRPLPSPARGTAL
jgi:hypothetical protein